MCHPSALTDEACPSCNPNGTFQRDGGAMLYTCRGGLVSLNISRFVVSSNGTVITPQTTQPGTTPTGGPSTTCPSGPLRGRRQLGSMPSALTCVEVYFLDAGFVGNDEIRGTYSATFTGERLLDVVPQPRSLHRPDVAGAGLPLKMMLNLTAR